MRFYYNMADSYTGRFDDHRTYYDEQTIRGIRIYPATPALDKAWSGSDDSFNLWPVHDTYENELVPVECASRDEAYGYLLESLNRSIYEYIHDI